MYDLSVNQIAKPNQVIAYPCFPLNVLSYRPNCNAEITSAHPTLKHFISRPHQFPIPYNGLLAPINVVQRPVEKDTGRQSQVSVLFLTSVSHVCFCKNLVRFFILIYTDYPGPPVVSCYIEEGGSRIRDLGGKPDLHESKKRQNCFTIA